MKMKCEHEWGPEERLREKMFGICFGVIRRCKKCPAILHADYTRGRLGSGWEIEYPKKEK